MTTPTPTRRNGLLPGGTPVKALEFLADNGPTKPDDLRAKITALIEAAREPGATSNPFYLSLPVLKELEAAGYVRTKVWLTPEGLAELHRLGWAPGAAEPADVTAESSAS